MTGARTREGSNTSEWLLELSHGIIRVEADEELPHRLHPPLNGLDCAPKLIDPGVPTVNAGLQGLQMLCHCCATSTTGRAWQS